MKINTHGLKMTGLKYASGDTKGLGGYYSGEYVELFYDRPTGEVFTRYQYSIGQNTWTKCHDKDVVKICNLSSKTTMQEIADKIAAKLEWIGMAGRGEIA